MSSTVGTLLVRLGLDAKDFKTEMGKVKGVLGAVMPFAGPAIVGLGFAKMIKGGMEFGYEMANVRALTQATDAQFKALSATAKELGATTQFTAKQAAEGMSFLSMAGFKAEEVIGAMPGVLQLAGAASLDLGRAADITSNILTGYGKDVSELGGVNDVLVKAFTSANVNLSMLGDSMKYAGPVAKAAGVEFEETAAAVGLLGNAGIQGTMAGSSLRNVISRMLNPSKEAAKVMKQLGLSALDSEGKFVGLTDLLQQLEKGMGKMGGEGERTAALMELFGQRAGPAVAALLEQGSEALNDFTIQLRRSGGIAEDIAKKKMDTLMGSWLKLKSAIMGTGIEGEEGMEPVLRKIVDAMTWVVTSFNDLGKNLGKSFAYYVDVIGLGFDWVVEAVIGGLEFFREVLLMGLGVIFTSAGDIVKTGWDNIKAAFTGGEFKLNIGEVLKQNMDIAMKQVTDNFKGWQGRLKNTSEKMDNIWDIHFGVEVDPKNLEKPKAAGKKAGMSFSEGFKEATDDFGKKLNDAIWNFSSNISDSLTEMVMTGKTNFEDLAKSFQAMIVKMIIQYRIVEPMMKDLGFSPATATAQGVPSQTGTPTQVTQAFGGAWLNGRLTAFAKGGVVSSPTLFPMANGMGLMGEAGPEAVMPLKRTRTGELGVVAEGGGGGAVNVIINNNSGAKASVTESVGADGNRQLEIMIDSMVSKSLTSGGGAKVLNQVYQVKRPVGRR